MKYKVGDWIKFKTRVGVELDREIHSKIIEINDYPYINNIYVEPYTFKFKNFDETNEHVSELIRELDIIDKLTDDEIFLAKLES